MLAIMLQAASRITGRRMVNVGWMVEDSNAVPLPNVTALTQQAAAASKTSFTSGSLYQAKKRCHPSGVWAIATHHKTGTLMSEFVLRAAAPHNYRTHTFDFCDGWDNTKKQFDR